MKFALLIYDEPGTYERLTASEREAVLGEYFAITKDDRVVGGEQLQPTQTAVTVRVARGDAVVTDGPFADTKEVLGGYYLVDADDQDAAVEIAKKIPAARLGGSVEVRPVVER